MMRRQQPLIIAAAMKKMMMMMTIAPLLSLCLPGRVTSFAVPPANTIPRQRASVLSSTPTQLFARIEDEVELRDVIQSLRKHPKSDFKRSEWDQIFSMIEERTAEAEENDVNLRAAEATATMAPTDFPLESQARKEMTEMYDILNEQNHLQLYGAVSQSMPPASGSNIIPPPLLEGILDLPMTALTPQPTNTIFFAGAIVAIIEGMVSLATNIPLNVLALTTIFIASIDRLFVNGAVLEGFLKILSPGTQQKIIRHEAGHFLAAYLLGCPVEGCVLSAWDALQDRRFGARQVSAGTSFFDPKLSKQINTEGKLTRDSIDRYSIIVMAGIAAEADAYGKADGGASDEMALVAFLSQLNSNRPGGGSSTWDYESIKNQARWGALQAVLMLRQYKPAYDALVDALERNGSLGDCIYAIEKAAQDYDLKPLAQPLGVITKNENGEAVWSTTMTTTNGATAAVSTIIKGSGSNGNFQSVEEEAGAAAAVSAPAAVTVTTTTKLGPLDEEESYETLRDYRAQVEEKLRVIDERLKEIQD